MSLNNIGPSLTDTGRPMNRQPGPPVVASHEPPWLSSWHHIRSSAFFFSPGGQQCISCEAECKGDSWRLPYKSHLQGHASHALSTGTSTIFLCCNMRFSMSIGHLWCCSFDFFFSFVLWCVTFAISWCCVCDIVMLQLLFFRCCIIFIRATFVSLWDVTRFLSVCCTNIFYLFQWYVAHALREYWT